MRRIRAIVTRQPVLEGAGFASAAAGLGLVAGSLLGVLVGVGVGLVVVAVPLLIAGNVGRAG